MFNITIYADEDLTFEEEGITKLRREIEVLPVAAPLQQQLELPQELQQETPSVLTRVRRQWGGWFGGGGSGSDDEDDLGSAVEEGSGMIMRIYRAKIHVIRNWNSAYSNKNSREFKDLAAAMEQALEYTLRDVPGTKTIKVSNIRRSPQAKLEITVDVNYEGWTDESASMRRKIRSLLESQYLGTIPVDTQYYSFDEPDVPAGRQCREGEHRCPSGRCVKRCDGRNECLDASDEFNCPELPVATVVTPDLGLGRRKYFCACNYASNFIAYAWNR
ncbi:hypothetical protein SK128_011865 [Halocaridina rubra]|uniref:SEA domain-containing protein n=1 Tax=Halocaridina rubra TaxID=373956 RepID=A0AAN8XHK0_HALRR